MVLQGARHDFGGGGGRGVDQDDDGHLLCDRRQAGERPDGVARAVVGFDRPEGVVGLRLTALRGNDVGALRQEGGGDADGCLEQAARVVAQVKHEAFEMTVLGQFVEILREILGRALLELRDADVAHLVVELLHLDGLRLDEGSDEREVERLVGAFAGHDELDLGVGLTAHELDGRIEGHVRYRLAVDARDDVACTHACACGGRVVDRGDDANARGVLRHFKPEAAERALSAFSHVLVALDVEEARVRIETAHHAVDGGLKELGV